MYVRSGLLRLPAGPFLGVKGEPASCAVFVLQSVFVCAGSNIHHLSVSWRHTCSMLHVVTIGTAKK